jgi:hypothetical protein
MVVLAAVVAVAGYFQVGTFKQPGDKSSFFSYGGDVAAFCFGALLSELISVGLWCCCLV